MKIVPITVCIRFKSLCVLNDTLLYHMLGWSTAPYFCGEAKLNINILLGLRLYDDVAAFAR